MKFLEYLKGEPVVVLDVIKALVALLVLFGLHLPVAFAATATALVLAVLTLVTRSKVVPARKVPEGA